MMSGGSVAIHISTIGDPRQLTLRITDALYRVGIEIIVEMDAIDVVAADDIHDDVEGVGAGFLFAGNDPANPTLEFETADAMGKAAVWICGQAPAQFTGNIVYDEELVQARGL